MTTSFSDEASLPNTIGISDDQLEDHCPNVLSLYAVDVLVITSGHEATDHRVYGKQALSLRQSGANVTVVGTLEHRTPGEVPIIPVAKSASRLTRFLCQPWRCLWAARKLRADIIHFHDPEMLATLPIAKLWWRRTRFVYDVHEDFGNLMLIRDWLPSWVKPLVKRLTDTVEKGLASLADAIVGVTPPLAEKFSSKERIVAYNYISRKFLQAAVKLNIKPDNRTFDLVHLGTLSLRRAGFLVEVLQEFHRILPGARSSVIGVSPDIEEAIRNRVPTGCILMGKVPHEQIPQILSNAKVGLDVHPWLGAHLAVAVPVKVCEYMAAGCAVVSSYMPVLKQILDESHVCPGDLRIIDGGNPIDYARAVAQMIEVIEQGADPGARLRKSALKHMVWEKEAVKIVELYRRLLKKPCVA
jgi:glycosyltransferase involved in cell wall biosynthesis